MPRRRRCVELRRERPRSARGPFEDLWIEPAAGDAGGGLGAAAAIWHQYDAKPCAVNRHDRMRGGYVGPRFGTAEIRAQLDAFGARYEERDDATLFARLAELLEQEHVIGWFQGRMEFGRARSVDARSSATRAARKCSP